MISVLAVYSCSEEPKIEEIMALDELRTEIFPDGTASNDAIYRQIDETTFYLNDVRYKIVDSHLEIIGCEGILLPPEPKLFAEVKINGLTLKTISINDYAFQRTECEKIVIPKTVTHIGKCSFGHCEFLTSIILPEGLEGIGFACFNHCYSLTAITLPEGLKELGDYCFQWCTALKRIKLPNSLTKIGIRCFEMCTSLTSVIVPEGITELSESCFYGCESLTAVTLSEGLKKISETCFMYCSSLLEITLPASVEYIDGYLCFDSFSLKTIYFQSLTPPVIEHVNGLYPYTTIYVPKESLDLYVQKYRGMFKDILPME